MNKKNTSHRIFISLAYITTLLIIFLSGVTRSYANSIYSITKDEGTCAPDPTKTVNADASRVIFTENKKGAVALTNDVFDQKINIYCYASKSPLQINYAYGEVNSLYPKSTVNPDAYKFNNDVDIQLHILLDPNVFLEFNSQEMKFYTPITITGTPPNFVHQYSFDGFFAVRFILRKSALGGAIIIPEGVILGKYYIYANSGQKGTVPFGNITTGGVIAAPIICNINSGNIIDVDFNIIDSSQLTTTSASSTLSLDKQLDYSCNNSLNQNISVKLVATASNFDGNAIKTSNKDIGIIMLQNGKPVPPGGAGFSTTLKDGKGSDTVTFVPVKSSSAKIATGAFNASATLIITAA